MNKTLLAIFIAATTAAQATSFQWGEDSPCAFNLTITGDGIPYSETFFSVRYGLGQYELFNQGTRNIFRDVFISPSGLWQVLAEIDVADFHGPGIGDLISITTNSIAILSKTEVMTPEHSLVFSSKPDIYDPTTWSWAMNIFAHDVNGTHVPEGGSMILGFLILLVLPLFHEKLRPLRIGK